MPFPELDKYKEQYPSLSSFLTSLGNYLSELSKSSKLHNINPGIVARKLSTNEGIALVLLMFAHETGLIEPEYLVYCNQTDFFMGTYRSLKDIPNEIFCDKHGENHSPSDYYIELVFRFSKKSTGEDSDATS